MREFYKITSLKTDPIYSGKMFYGLVDQLKNNKIFENKKIIALHSGGLSGIEGFEKRYKLKIFN
jgi:1-aminocyclopropane-1-carboxylate deaminase